MYCTTCEDVVFLISTGAYRKDLPQRVGMSPEALVKHLRSHGHRDLTAGIEPPERKRGYRARLIEGEPG